MGQRHNPVVDNLGEFVTLGIAWRMYDNPDDPYDK